jgi:K+-transporting ATPase ATPase A chain
VLLLSRFLPIISHNAGLLANKKYIPGVLNFKTDTTILSYGFAVIAIIAALSFFPALALGP